MYRIIFSSSFSLLLMFFCLLQLGRYRRRRIQQLKSHWWRSNTTLPTTSCCFFVVSSPMTSLSLRFYGSARTCSIFVCVVLHCFVLCFGSAPRERSFFLIKNNTFTWTSKPNQKKLSLFSCNLSIQSSSDCLFSLCFFFFVASYDTAAAVAVLVGGNRLLLRRQFPTFNNLSSSYECAAANIGNNLVGHANFKIFH